MEKQVFTSPEINRALRRIGSEVQPDEIDAYAKTREIEDKSHKLRTVLSSWEHQQNEERTMRRSYANGLKVALFIQGFLANIAFFGIALDLFHIEKWVAITFIMAVFSEISALVLIIVKYLFPDTTSALLDLIERL